MKSKPNILITNDDGIHAPGIRHLWNSLHEKANITIVAPSTEQSAVGLSITIRRPLHLEKVDWPKDGAAWSVTGTPADCIKLALNVVLKDNPPDIILSGINRGTNSGRNILYSGTVAAVIEGIMHNIPGIAFSCRHYTNPDFITAEKYIPRIVDHVLEHPLPNGSFLNVNFPCHEKTVNGIKLTKHGKEFWMENPDERRHPAEGHSYYWLGAKLAKFDEDEECDVSWLTRGYITAVPIRIDELTNHHHIADHKERFEKLF